MKVSFLIMNAGIILFLVSISVVFSFGPNQGQNLALISGIILSVGFINAFVTLTKNKKNFHYNSLILIIAAFGGSIILFEAFANSLDFSVLSAIPSFLFFHRISGFIILIVIGFLGWQSLDKLDKNWKLTFLKVAFSVFLFLSFIGIAAFARLIPIPVKSVYYGWLTFLFALSSWSIINYFSNEPIGRSKEDKISLLIGISLFIYWFFRWNIKSEIPNDIFRFILDFGLPVCFFLPLALIFLTRNKIITIFIVYIIVIDLFFIQFDQNFRTLVKIGTQKCIGFEKAENYRPNFLNKEEVDFLFEKVKENEIQNIRNKWINKNYDSVNPKIEYQKTLNNGETLKVISHYINSNKHYGIALIPKGITHKNAPILLALPGKSGQFNAISEDFLIQKLPHHLQCESLNQYIKIIPSFRGNVVIGKGFSFRSEGYSNDNWHGASEDALMFLETFKQMHNKTKNSKVIALGVSRGATVGLIAASLSDKIDYVISVSTHTNFHNLKAYNQRPLYFSYPKAFYAPKTNLNEIRERIIASSPVYFTKYLPPFQIHQGENDLKTNVLHANFMKEAIKPDDLNAKDREIFIHKDKGHGYIDSQIACETLTKFSAYEID